MTTVGAVDRPGAGGTPAEVARDPDRMFGDSLAWAMRAQGTARRDPTSQPTVSINRMLDAYASTLGPVQTSTPPGRGLAASPDLVGPISRVASGPWDTVTERSGAAGHAVLRAGERYLGTPYVWGGDDASVGFDCSGFVQQTYADLGVRLPRVSAEQGRAGASVDGLDSARPGDLVFWNGDGSRPNHIGIYAGDGRMLVAPSTGDVVRYQEITREPHSIRRILT